MPKLKLVQDALAWAIPLPERATVCGVLLALLLTVRVALSAPTSEGVKIMGMEQDAPTVPVHVLVPSAKSAAFVPEIGVLLIVTGFPVTVPTTVLVGLDVSGTLPKFKLAGAIASAPAVPPIERLQTFAVSGVELSLIPLMNPSGEGVAVERNW